MLRSALCEIREKRDESFREYGYVGAALHMVTFVSLLTTCGGVADAQRRAVAQSLYLSKALAARVILYGRSSMAYQRVFSDDVLLLRARCFALFFGVSQAVLYFFCDLVCVILSVAWTKLY